MKIILGDFRRGWSFSDQRLVIARDLLSEDGVLICCINDDNRDQSGTRFSDKVFPGCGLELWSGEHATRPVRKGGTSATSTNTY